MGQPKWVVKVGKKKISGATERVEWKKHSAPFVLKSAAVEYAALVRKLEPQHELVEIFPV